MKVLRTFVLCIGFAALATACGGSSKEESTTPAADTATEPAGDMGGEDMGAGDMGGGDDMGNPCGDDMGNPCGDDMGGDDMGADEGGDMDGDM